MVLVGPWKVWSIVVCNATSLLDIKTRENPSTNLWRGGGSEVLVYHFHFGVNGCSFGANRLIYKIEWFMSFQAIFFELSCAFHKSLV